MNNPRKLRLHGNRKAAGFSPAETGEGGYILLAVLFMVVLVTLTLALAAPKIAADIERDREIELMHRGNQYRRAIQLYYRKFQAYPPNVDALVKTSEIRFLRRRYVDPATGKDEWHLIHFGENKTPTAMGFFGQAIAGSTLAGTGPGGVGQNLGTSMTSAFGSNGSNGSNGLSNSSFGGGSSSGFGNSSFGSNSNSSFGNSSPTAPATTDTNTATSSGGTTNSANGTSSTGGTGSSTSGSSSSSFGGNGQTFGGAGIIGVESTSAKATILEFKKKKHFNEWEFTYDPAQERQTVSSNIGIGQPAGGPGNSNSPFSNSPGASSSGSSSSTVPPPVGSAPDGGTPQQNQNQQQ